jgi:hypothetical protein
MKPYEFGEECLGRSDSDNQKVWEKLEPEDKIARKIVNKARDLNRNNMIDDVTRADRMKKYIENDLLKPVPSPIKRAGKPKP